MFGRHFFLFLAFLVFYVFTRKESRVFKGIFEKIKEADKNNTTTIDDFSVMNATNATEADMRRNLRARHQQFGGYFNNMDPQFDSMMNSADLPVEVKQMMSDMHMQSHQMMNMMDDDLDEVFQRHQLPPEVEEQMRAMRKQTQQHEDHHEHHDRQKKVNKRQRVPTHAHEDEEDDQFYQMKKMAYRMFAPALWEQASKHSRSGRHGPMVGADKKKDAED